MVQAYSGDLRSRVIKAAVDGMSARQAAARFGVGVATAIVWIRRFRANGEATARRQGKTARLPARRPTPTSSSPSSRQAARTSRWPRSQSGSRRSVAFASGSPASGSFWIVTVSRTKKDRPRRRTGSRGRPCGAASLVRRSARSRSRQADLHRRDRRFDQDGAPARTLPARRALQGRDPARPLEDHHLHRPPCAAPA